MGLRWKSSHTLHVISEENWRYCSFCPIRLPKSHNAGTLQYSDEPLLRKPRDYKEHYVRSSPQSPVCAAQTDPRWWNGAEPIWVTNQKQKGASGVLYWPGYNIKIKGMYPKYREYSPSPNVDQFNKTGKVMSFEKRTEKVIDWLTSKNPPNFVAVYFGEPDKTCHYQGWSDLPEVIERVDKTVGLIVEGLKRHELLDKVNIIITADHGMSNTSCNKVIDLDKYVDPENYDFWDSFFNMLLVPKAGKMEDVYKRPKKCASSSRLSQK